ncbi:MAG: sugar ABC transporter permease [Erysipelotrichaceae bacterium]|jgi:multiple sugar transport system permease protein|nr:sugar ABC transporter permease [Bacillota bacterium]
MKRRIEKIEPILFITPALIGIIVFTLYPFVNVIIMAFKEDYNFLTTEFTKFGLKNFEIIFNDPYFIQAMKNSFMYVLIVVPVSTAIAVIVANLLNQNIRFKAFLQTSYFLPMVTSITAVGMAWKFMFNYQNGIINYVLSFFGVDAINWLQNPNYNFLALVIYGIWSILPFTIIVLLSGLQNINPLYYTAAKVDGAKAFKIFQRITLPLLAPTIGLVMVINTISTFKVFNELFPLFQGPGIAYNLFTVVYYIYYHFRSLTPPKYGIAAAAAIILFFMILIFTSLQIYIQKKGSVYKDGKN